MRPLWRDGRVWASAAAVVAIGITDMLLPPRFIVLSLLVVPIVASVVMARPAVPALLTGLASLTVVVAADVHHYDFVQVTERLLTVTLAGAVGAYLALVLGRRQAQLTEARNQYRLLAENASDVVYAADHDRRVTWVSPTIARVLGWTPEQVLGRAMGDFIHPDDRAATEGDRSAIYSGREIDQPVGGYVVRVRAWDGGYRWMSVRLMPAGDGSQGGVAVVGSLTDVTDQVRQQQALEESERRFRLMAEHSSDVVLLVEEGLLRWVSPSLTSALGWEPGDWLGRHFSEFLHPDDIAEAQRRYSASTAGDAVVTRVRFRAKDGSWHWVEVHSGPFADAAPGAERGVVASFRIIDKEVVAELELERRAVFDDLTGVLKRNEALAQLQAMGRQQRTPGDRTAVLFIDIDDFKAVNDTRGHAAGDAVLLALSQRMRNQVRGADLVARLGGDEFLVVLQGLHDDAEALAVAEKIRQHASQPVATEAGEVRATISIGVTFAEPLESVDAIMARADLAMYRAKQSGRDQVVFFDGEPAPPVQP